MAVRESTGFVAAAMAGQSFASIFANGCIEIRSGAQPDLADLPATGTLLAVVTRDGGAWNAGSPLNGLNFMQAGRSVVRMPAEAWWITGLDTGTAAWARLVGNSPDDGGASATAPRIDFAIGQATEDEAFPAGAQLVLPSTAISPATNRPLTQFVYAR